MDVWIKHQRLWALAMDKAGQTVPKWTKAFWKKAAEVYQELGGKLEEPQEEME